MNNHVNALKAEAARITVRPICPGNTQSPASALRRPGNHEAPLAGGFAKLAKLEAPNSPPGSGRGRKEPECCVVTHAVVRRQPRRDPPGILRVEP